MAVDAPTGNNPLRIAICEDTPTEARILISFIEESGIVAETTHYLCGEDLLAVFEKGAYDLIFLDVYMGAISGVETAEAVREKDAQVVIVFTTTSDDFTREGYRLNAYKYMLKPINPEDVVDALELASLKRDKAQGATLGIVVDGVPVTLLLSDILYVESNNRRSVVFTEDGEYATLTTIDALEKMLPAPRFLRSHRAFIVNLDHVEDVDTDFIMDNGARAYIRVKDFRKLKHAYDDYLFNSARSGE
ncbi:MAG: LytTR family DNA-binding domain-containing protein [Coriobacteriales bacterium]|jgi:DNA-binding LytR/AlgR family response regulator|nr:LytTR family DNA-binding domain-containing protein [Coriobacteriales bacterium]